MYYIVDLDTLTILAGPYSLQDAAIKNRTNCGNPECLPNLSTFGILPVSYSELEPHQQYSSTPVVTTNAVIFSAVTIPLEQLKTKLLGELAAIRYEHEIAGITVNNVKIKTDRKSVV